ncbi:DUF3040 domain-containing protein [Nocardiopsis dassonvillei]|uniref:DUF3040 domain-containing protein n=1 Tax=Nocardiopsis dassonvillei (strain ATCC 23218 / DSM 43111 / CIP 107115 / JCM 7437 / KCTC 9190 / NBRC 14626 / NCTC 10488 / NRRL B-5397 / IMRU 509) TaxID=446468 RepID=D7AXS1_NOCDD|nr:DUF3040 domain-containing protein [Nocardiopsis dassonvillei]ADH67975.1 conserved hypothetical protein [Nocardiopsis dassonvillei subsp. dassonvillei DSM 43111]NKY79505.1 DUF3040 domain-containing protein [Nocardiopsis dassonvillei]VEI88474.1 Protein of uncharacterised function (DUF3040) [Nocardiopsis dassonvillei]
MSLREHERRILAEIERQLSEEEPDLAGRLESFGSGDPDAPADPGLGGWKPWVACGLIAAVTAGLLVMLFVLTPSTPQPSAPAVPTETSQTTGDPAPDPDPEPAPEGPEAVGTS